MAVAAPELSPTEPRRPRRRAPSSPSTASTKCPSIRVGPDCVRHCGCGRHQRRARRAARAPTVRAGVNVTTPNSAPVEPQGPRRCAPLPPWPRWMLLPSPRPTARPSSHVGPAGARQRDGDHGRRRARRATRAPTVRDIVAIDGISDAPVEPRGPRRCAPACLSPRPTTRPSSREGPDGARRPDPYRAQRRARRATRTPTVRAVVDVTAPDGKPVEPLGP